MDGAPAADLESLARQVREGLTAHRPVSDALFDGLLSPAPRSRSLHYWSSVEVAQTASRWLTGAGALRVLDVGSGVGKFCAIASLTSGHRLWGVEVRGPLVHESRALAQRLGAEVVIIDGTLDQVDATRFDAFYFFNPFAEHLAERHERYDEHFPRSVDAFLHDVKTVERWLRAAPVGSAMVTYNGLGGRIPLSWMVQRSMVLGGDHLRLWVKRGTDESRDAIIEIDEHLIRSSLLAGLMRKGDQRIRDDSLVSRLVSLGEP